MSAQQIYGAGDPQPDGVVVDFTITRPPGTSHGLILVSTTAPAEDPPDAVTINDDEGETFASLGGSEGVVNRLEIMAQGWAVGAPLRATLTTSEDDPSSVRVNATSGDEIVLHFTGNPPVVGDTIQAWAW